LFLIGTYVKKCHDGQDLKYGNKVPILFLFL